MKISILTQPLGHNYGGLLQAYALQKYLMSEGHIVETVDRRRPNATIPINLKKYVRNFVRLILGRIKSMPRNRTQDIVHPTLRLFRDQHLRMSPVIRDENGLQRYYAENDFDAVIVGSDQVWRPRYSPCLRNFFLDFLEQVGGNVRRISYAASFGVDEWEYSAKETEECKRLVNKFDALSVRERSAQTLCQRYFGVNPKLMLDPTFLLSTEKYRELIGQNSLSGNKGKVLTYFLDPLPSKLEQAQFVASTLNLECFSVTQNIVKNELDSDSAVECVFPPVEVWLQSFDEAAFVITDSFHGTVFSIIFNKPFIAVGNASRGISRFDSLLQLFGLSERLVFPESPTEPELLLKKIDWEAVNKIRLKESKLSEAFLKESLGESA
jgi:hypothetical protein